MKCHDIFNVFNFVPPGTPYQVITPGGHPPPTMPNQFTSISQTGTSIAGGIAAMPGQAIPAQAQAGNAGVAASGANMMLSMSTSSSIANSTPYQFPITSHANASNIQQSPGYPQNAQTIIYVSYKLSYQTLGPEILL